MLDGRRLGGPLLRSRKNQCPVVWCGVVWLCGVAVWCGCVVWLCGVVMWCGCKVRCVRVVVRCGCVVVWCGCEV